MLVNKLKSHFPMFDVDKFLQHKPTPIPPLPTTTTALEIPIPTPPHPYRPNAPFPNVKIYR
jgi:hypothetical protein